MNQQEIEVFKGLLEMLGQAGEASVWLLVAWWCVSLLKLLIIVGGMVGGIIFAIKTIVLGVSECSQIDSWCSLLGMSPYSGRAAAKAKITRLIHENKGKS
jgi:hypothetical protein